jgi:hypothetical protein
MALLLYVLLRFAAWVNQWPHNFTRLFTLLRRRKPLALFCNLHLTRTSWDQLFAFTVLDNLAPSLGGGGDSTAITLDQETSYSTAR